MNAAEHVNQCNLHYRKERLATESMHALVPIHETAALLSHINTSEDSERKLATFEYAQPWKT